MDFLEKEIGCFFIHLSLNFKSSWVCVKTHFLLVWIQEEAKIEFDVDSQGEKLKVKGISQVIRE